MHLHQFHTAAARDRLSNIVQQSSKRSLRRPARTDRYLAASQLQKAIRRDEVALAWEAASFLYGEQQAYFWRRLPIIALEDIGVGDPELVMAVVLAASEPDLRNSLGGGLSVASALVAALCAAPKDRSPDDLFDLISRDADSVETRAQLAELSPSDVMNGRAHRRNDAPMVALRLARLAGCVGDIPCNQLHKTAWRDAMVMIVCSAPPPLIQEMALLGLQRTGSILAPLLFAVGTSPDWGGGVVDDPFQEALPECDPPVWIAGMHTRAGLAGFRKYISKSRRMTTLLTVATGEISKSKVIGGLVFRLDCGQLRHRLRSEQSENLKASVARLGWGIPDDAVPEAFSILEEEYGLLNQCRATALEEYFR